MRTEHMRFFQNTRKLTHKKNSSKTYFKPHLGKELLFPVIQILKRVQLRNIVHENATVRSTVERNPKRLKALLTSCIPNLQRQPISRGIYHALRVSLVSQKTTCPNRHSSCYTVGQNPCWKKYTNHVWRIQGLNMVNRSQLNELARASTIKTPAKRSAYTTGRIESQERRMGRKKYKERHSERNHLPWGSRLPELAHL